MTPTLFNPYRFAAGSAIAGWKYLDHETLTTDEDNIGISGLDDYPFYLALMWFKGDGDIDCFLKLGDSSGLAGTGDYAFRASYQGDAQADADTQNHINFQNNFGGYTDNSYKSNFTIALIQNFSGQEKVADLWYTFSRPAVTNRVSCGNGCGKANFTNALEEIRFENNPSVTGDFLTDSELVVFGFDPTDPTGGAFEEIGSGTQADGSSLNANISDTKKYMFYQGYLRQADTGSAKETELNFFLNNDRSGASYSYGYNQDGGSYAGTDNTARLYEKDTPATYGWFMQGWIASVSGYPKLVSFIDSSNSGSTASTPNLSSMIGGGAYVGTGATSSVDFDIQSGTPNITDGELKVWGFTP